MLLSSERLAPRIAPTDNPWCTRPRYPAQLLAAHKDEPAAVTEACTALKVVTVAKSLIKKLKISLKLAPAPRVGGGPRARAQGTAAQMLYEQATPATRKRHEDKVEENRNKDQDREANIRALHTAVKKDWEDNDGLKGKIDKIFGLAPREGLAACTDDAPSTFEKLLKMGKDASRYASRRGLPEQDALRKMQLDIDEQIERVISVRAGEQWVKDYLKRKQLEDAAAAAKAAAGGGPRRRKKKKNGMGNLVRRRRRGSSTNRGGTSAWRAWAAQY